MLGGIPMDMVPEPIIAEVLGQLVGAFRGDDGSLGHPTIPFDLLGALCRSEAVVTSLKESVEIPDDKPSQQVVEGVMRTKAWSLKTSLSSTYKENNASGGSGSGSRGPGEPASAPQSFVGSSPGTNPKPPHYVSDPPGRTHPIQLQLRPVSSSHRPLSELWGDTVSSVLESMLRSFNTGHVDSNGFCDQLQQLFGVIFELVGHQEGWALQWVEQFRRS